MTDIIKTEPDDEVKLKGTVKYVAKDGRDSLLKDAKVKAVNSELGITRSVTTNEKGDYHIDRIRKGNWLLSASAPGYQTVSKNEHEVKDDTVSQDFLLYPNCVSSDGTIDLALGKWFLMLLIALLVTLITGYIWSHNKSRTSPQVTQQAIKEVVQQAAKLVRIEEDKFSDEHALKLAQLSQYLSANSKQPLIRSFFSTEENNHFNEAAELLTALSLAREKTVIDKGKKRPEHIKNDKQINGSVTDKNPTINNETVDLPQVTEPQEDKNKPEEHSPDQKTKVLAILDSLKKDLDRRSLRYGYLWSEMPWRILEILFWATAGILVNNIMSTGYYLRKRTFYREGIPMYISHLFAIPIMVVVVVLLLSVFTIEFVFQGSTGFTLDINSPVMLICISFLLASKPWAIRGFLRKRADNVLGNKDAKKYGE